MKKCTKKFSNRFLFRLLSGFKTSSVFSLGIYSILSLIAHRGIVFANGMPGHSIDWSVPATTEQLSLYSRSTWYLWWDQFLGAFNFHHIFGIFQDFGTFPGLLGVPGWAVIKIWLVFVPALSGYVVYLLVRDILSDDGRRPVTLKISFFAFLAGFFFAFGPFRFSSTMSGEFFSLQLAWLFLPLAIRYYRKLFIQPTWKNSLLLGISAFFTSANTQILIFYFIIIFCLTFILYKHRKVEIYKNAGIVFTSYVLLLLPAIVTAVFVYTEAGGSLYASMHELSGQFLLDTISSEPGAVPFFEAIIGIAYPFDFYIESLPQNAVIVFEILAALMVSIVIITTLFSRNRELYVYLGLFIIFTIFASGGLAPGPLGDGIRYLYEHFDAMIIYRTPAYFLIPSNLLLCVLLGYSFNKFTEVLPSINVRSRTVFKPVVGYLTVVLLTVTITAPFFYHGDFAGFLDTYRMPPYYDEVLKSMFNDNEDYRIAFVPVGRIPEFIETDYQKGGPKADDPLVIFSPKPTLDSNRKYFEWSADFQLLTEKMLYAEPDFMQVPLYLSNVKYVIVRKDVLPSRPDNGPLYSFDNQIANLESNDHFTRTYSGEQAIVYQLDQVLPRVNAYSLDKATLIYNLESMETTLKNEVFEPSSDVFIPLYYFSDEKSEQIEDLLTAQSIESVDSTNLPSISYKHSTSTHYEITVTGAKSPFILAVSDAYSPLWKASFEFTNGKAVKDISEDNHFIANGYENAWYIDQEGDYTISIEFAPQKLYWWSRIVSLIALILISLLLVSEPLVRNIRNR